MTYEISDSIHISAQPDDLYALLSDVTRTGEWSQQCYLCEWSEPGHHGVGSTFVGHNRTPSREWSTTSEVVAADPGRHFAWEVIPARVRWGYRLEPEGDGTRVTQYTMFGETVETVFSERFGEDAENQVSIRREAAEYGIPQTLKEIKNLAE